MGTGGYYHGVKLTTHLHLVPLKCEELYLHTPIRLPGTYLYIYPYV